MKNFNFKTLLKDKKSQARLIKGLVIGIFLISIFSLVFVLAEEGLTEESEISSSENTLDFRLGSIVIDDLDNSVLKYTTAFADITFKLSKESENIFSIDVNNTFIENVKGKHKFGAIDSSNEGIERYKYVIESSKKIIRDKNNFYVSKSYFDGFELKQEQHIIDLTDICMREFDCEIVQASDFDYLENITVCNTKANCDFNYTVIKTYLGEDKSGISQFEKRYILEVTFNSDKNIDPTIYIREVSLDFSFKDGVISENKFSHLNITDNAPYDSLVLYMSFDNNVSNYQYDYSKYNNDGSGDYIFVEDGLYAGSGNFDGDGDYIEIVNSSSLNISKDLTISVWAKMLGQSSDSDWPRVVSKGQTTTLDGGYSLFVTDPDRSMSGCTLLAEDEVRYGSTMDNGVENDNLWHHYVCVYNSTNLIFYVDGVEVNKTYVNSTIKTVTDSLNIGSGRNGERDFNGSIDEVMIFNNSLTSSQITDIYNNQSLRFEETGIQIFYPQVVDSSSNKINLSVDFQNFMDTILSSRFGYWNITAGYNNSFDSNLVSYWRFDENSWDGINGEVKDVLGINNASINGTINITNFGFYYNGAEFDESGEYINVSNPVGLDVKNVTVSSWVRLNNATPESYQFVMNRKMTNTGTVTQFVWGSSQNYTWGTQVRLEGSEGTGRLISSDVPATTNWTNLITTYDGDKLKLYINGILQEEIDDTDGAIDTDNPGELIIGAHPNGDKNFEGIIDEVMIYNRSLSQNEITNLAVLGKANWEYTDYRNLTQGTNALFSILNSQTNILPEFKFFSNDNQFYTPILQNQFSYTFYDSCECPSGQNWEWNLAEDCTLQNGACNVQEITMTGSGTWTLDNYTINTTKFSMSSTGDWNIIGMSNVKIIGTE